MLMLAGAGASGASSRGSIFPSEQWEQRGLPCGSTRRHAQTQEGAQNRAPRPLKRGSLQSSAGLPQSEKLLPGPPLHG